MYLAAIDEVDRRIDDQLISGLDPTDHFHPGAQIALHSYFADFHRAIGDNCDLHSVAVEDERIGRHRKARRLARDM